MKITEPKHAADVESLLAQLPAGDRRVVVHIGAQRGEEVDSYFAAGFERIVLIEANPSLHEELVKRFGADGRVQLFHCAIADSDGVIDLHVHTSRTGSAEPASILPLKRFKEIVRTLHTPRTVTVPCRTLDSLFEEHGLSPGAVSLLNIDVQGAELLVLKGAQRVLRSASAVIAEVNLLELYEGSVPEEEIVAFMAARGFRKVDAVYHTLYDESSTFPAWGECLFMKERTDG